MKKYVFVVTGWNMGIEVYSTRSIMKFYAQIFKKGFDNEEHFKTPKEAKLYFKFRNKGSLTFFVPEIPDVTTIWVTKCLMK